MATAPSGLFTSAIACAVALAIASTAAAQSPTYGVGRAPTADELKAIDIDVSPDGKGLPPGRGTAAEGKAIYASRCAVCHGATGREGPQDVIAGGQGSLKAPARPVKTVGSYWPYATTLWDYLRRAMPFDHPGTMSADDVYSTTAYVLFLNGIVAETDVIDQTTLPKLQMPNRDGFTTDPRPDTTAKDTKETKDTNIKGTKDTNTKRIKRKDPPRQVPAR
jgi:S-disulfanyl-L-cysteine oxidoreductase SoxD